MKIIMTILAIVVSVSAFADDGKESKDYYNYLTQKIIEDFQNGVKLYNEQKDDRLPVIKKGLKQNYVMVIKNSRIRFSIVNYLNDQMYVNDKIVQRSTFGQAKTTWSNPFLNEAVAAEGNIDVESTKVLLTALGSFSGKLEEVGMMCFSGCEKDVKNNNRTKIYNTLNRQLDDCNGQLDAQSDSLKKFPSYQMVSLLHSTFNPEFTGVKNFIQKISETNAKKVKEFMAEKMIVNKIYNTCVEVITSGTIVDSSGFSNIVRYGGTTSVEASEVLEKAQKICIKMDELKSCLQTIRKNLNTINTIKRDINKKGYNSPLETLPEMKGLAR